MSSPGDWAGRERWRTPQSPASRSEPMKIGSKFWRRMAAKFRALPDPKGELTAMRSVGRWRVYGGPARHQESLQRRFICLARAAAIAAGVANRAHALDSWLDRLRGAGAYFNAFVTYVQGVEVQDGIVDRLCLASAEYCEEMASQATEMRARAWELEMAAKEVNTPAGLRRDRYPCGAWLYDHAHQTLPDPKEELAYWQEHVWSGYHALLQHYQDMQLEAEEPENRVQDRERLKDAIAGLSYDLAVLQANSILDRCLVGEDATMVFRKEVADLLEIVQSTWRASCKQLNLPGEESTEGLENPFLQVQLDLEQLVRAAQAALLSAGVEGPNRQCERAQPAELLLAKQAAPPRRPGKQAVATGFELVKREIRELKKLDYQQEEICKRLGIKPRPPHAGWRDMTWPEAFRHPKFRRAVKSWLSRV